MTCWKVIKRIKIKMYKILIVWALSQELNIVKEQIKELALRNIKSSFLTTWIWNYNMILNLTRFLEQNNDFDFIINIWVCGYTSPQSSSLKEREQDEFIQIWRIFNLSNKKELIIPNLFDFWKLSSIASSEKVIYNYLELEWEEYVDMESYWFEKVCDSFSLPRIILKVPVDKIWKETKNFDFKKANDLLQNNIDYKKLLEKIEWYLENTFSIQRKVKEKWVLKKYKEYFWFTFSENEIFKRFYYRYNALVDHDFDIYFEANKNFGKKEFLNGLWEYLEWFLVK